MAGAAAQLVHIPVPPPSPQCAGPQKRCPPINFIYGHFHNSLRAELSYLTDRVRSLEVLGNGAETLLSDLLQRYKFLEQVYKYHSTVEDEVLYPALDSKVRNVTLAYSVEHQDEEILFKQLRKLITEALEEPEIARKGTIRTLICKVEEIHTTLRKHLAKEEEQLLPLLLLHFSSAEQAELVAQFLYSIPLETVERVLSQLKPLIPRDEQEQLLVEIRNVIPDNLLSQLLVTWLQPAACTPSLGAAVFPGKQPVSFLCCGNPGACIYGPQSQGAPGPAPKPVGPAAICGLAPLRRSSDGEGQCGGCSPICSDLTSGDVDSDTAAITSAGDAQPSAGQEPSASYAEGSAAALGGDTLTYASGDGAVAASDARRRAPLQDIIHFHRSICSSLADFAREARSLQLGREITAAHLSALLERHRFLRSVIVFHSISEEEVLLPEVKRLAAHLGTAASQQCEREHETDLSSFEDQGRLLADVRALARRGRKEVSSMLEKLCCGAEAVCASIEHHMQREEADVFPLLEAHLCEAQQRVLLYRTIRAMPLRLLERVMPWVVSGLDTEAAAGLLSNLRLGAPSSDQALVELLTRWARRGWRGVSPSGVMMDRSIACGQALGARDGCGVRAASRGEHSSVPEAVRRTGVGEDASALHGMGRLALCTATCGPRFLQPTDRTYVAAAVAEDGADSKRRKLTEDPHHGRGAQALVELVDSNHTAAMRAGGMSWLGLDCAVEGCVEHELSTAPRALLCGRESRSPGSQPECLGGNSDNGAARACSNCSNDGGYNPIDHIFQFHKALRRELKQMEADAISLEQALLARVRQQHQQHQAQRGTPVANASGDGFTSAHPEPQLAELVGGVDTPPRHSRALGAQEAAHTCSVDSTGALHGRGGLLPIVQNFHGRFQFLQGIYRAHSKAEDEIVFPALEAKQALRNVSHAYTLDHRQEEHLFADLEQAIDNLRAVDLTVVEPEVELSRLVMGVRRMCAAIRASLETHIRSEESELWPLFTEHFSLSEQQYLVGVIIGRTGAQVLQAMLPWVSETFSAEERDAMMDSLRAATRNTMFDQWLEAVQGAGQGASAPAGADGPAASCSGSMGLDEQARVSEPLQEVAEYLAGGAMGSVERGSGALFEGAGAGAGHGAVEDSSSFRPGWEDIFRMNQQQLEAAIHRVSNDSSLEPERKAYLMQNIMVSKYIVAQQRRMLQSEAGELQPQGSATAGVGGVLGSINVAAAAMVSPRTADAVGTCISHAPAATHHTFNNAAMGVLGCKHYQRKCQLVAPCCGQIHTCRLCHDEVCDHRMDRYAVSDMHCMLCGTRQPVAGSCRCCGATLARYYCNICHLFDDEPGKDIYHCPFCNVCRRGRGLGVDFFHCMNCNACMSLSLFSSHKCREKCIEGNCPVCHEAIFDSSQPIKELPCGHFMHSTCFATYTRYNYTCPLCCKSVGDMSVYFQMLDSLLASERLPPEYAGRMQQVLCNDCGKMGFAPFHFVYHSCPHCRSYNTRVL